jgi:hypothetical protein
MMAPLRETTGWLVRALEDALARARAGHQIALEERGPMNKTEMNQLYVLLDDAKIAAGVAVETAESARYAIRHGAAITNRRNDAAD